MSGGEFNRFRPVSMGLESTNKHRFAEELGASFRNFGFAAIVGHGLDQELIDNAYRLAAEFFSLPAASKNRYRIAGKGGARGYTPFGKEVAQGETAVDLKEFWHVGRDLPPSHPHSAFMDPNIVPDEIDGWESTMHRLYAELDKLGTRLLRAIALDLGLPEFFFDDAVRDGNSVMRVLHYPALTGNVKQHQLKGSIRAGAHSDINAITLLLGAEEGGLEILTRDGEWTSINPPPGSLVVNIGDMLARSTNGMLPSTPHRVVNPPTTPGKVTPSRPRYSLPFFLHYRPDYIVEPLSVCVDQGDPGSLPMPITAHDFLMQRLHEIGLLKDVDEAPRERL